MEKRCGNCALKALKNGMCPIFNANMEDENGCPHFTTNISFCSKCGSLILTNKILIEDENKFHMVCANCGINNPCGLCANVNDCIFETDASCPEPPQVVIQQRRGNMVTQTLSLNMKRVKLTCEKKCPCFRSEGLEDGDFCWKKLNCRCSNHQYKW